MEFSSFSFEIYLYPRVQTCWKFDGKWKNWTRSCMRWKSYVWFCKMVVRMTYLSIFPLSPPKKSNSALNKVARVQFLYLYLKNYKYWSNLKNKNEIMFQVHNPNYQFQVFFLDTNHEKIKFSPNHLFLQFNFW